MPASEKALDPKAARNPLPPKLAALVRESSWLAFLALALYLLLILLTVDKADPGWSHSVYTERIANSGGVVGAYISDLLLFVFGISAYWWIVLCGALVLWGFRRIETERESDRRSYTVAMIGFLIFLIWSNGANGFSFVICVSVLSAISLISAPAANAFPFPVMTEHFWLLSLSTSESAS